MNLYKYHTNPKSLSQSEIKLASISVNFYDGTIDYTEGYEKNPSISKSTQIVELPKDGKRKELIKRAATDIIYDMADAGFYDLEAEANFKKWSNWANQNASKLITGFDDMEEIQKIVALKY